MQPQPANRGPLFRNGFLVDTRERLKYPRAHVTNVIQLAAASLFNNGSLHPDKWVFPSTRHGRVGISRRLPASDFVCWPKITAHPARSGSNWAGKTKYLLPKVIVVVAELLVLRVLGRIKCLGYTRVLGVKVQGYFYLRDSSKVGVGLETAGAVW